MFNFGKHGSVVSARYCWGIFFHAQFYLKYVNYQKTQSNVSRAYLRNTLLFISFGTRWYFEKINCLYIVYGEYLLYNFYAIACVDYMTIINLRIKFTVHLRCILCEEMIFIN